MDIAGAVGLILFVLIWVAYIFVVIFQYYQCSEETERLVILNLRAALFLPIYALIMFLAILKPSSLAGLNILITFFEGYSFYSFYSLIIYNLGGPAKAIEAFGSVEKDLACCHGYCPKDPTAYYRRTLWSLFHFLVTRTLLIIASTISAYGAKNASLGHVLTALFSLVSTVILVIALLHIILFCKFIMSQMSFFWFWKLLQ